MSELLRRPLIAEIVRTYVAQVKRVRDAFETVADAEKVLSESFFGASGPIRIRAGRYQSQAVSWDDADGAIDSLKRDCWRAIIERAEVRRLLSDQRSRELDARLEKGELPELTEDAVWDLVAFYSENVGAMMRECVEEVFSWLRPGDHSHAAKLKTNQKNARVELGQKIVIPYGVSYWSKLDDRPRIDWQDRGQWVALEKVFAMLDGKGDLGLSPNPEIIAAVEKSSVGETTYFRYRACKNRNLHLEFKRMDLVAKLNAVAGGKNLKPEAA